MTAVSLFVPVRLLLAVSVCLATSDLAKAQAPVSDDFNGSSLNTSLWTVGAPAGGNVTTSNGHALLAVPGGSNHDAFVGGNNSVEMLQSVSNQDFDVAVKFDSSAQKQYQGEGILVVQNSSTYLRFELLGIGTQTIVTADFVTGGNQTQLVYKAAPSFTGSVWLQVQRSGNSWSISSSTDGINFTTAGSFSQTLTLTEIGPYAWNYNANPSSSPALIASVDYFHNLSNAVTTAAVPTFSPAGGTSFSGNEVVTITDSTAGAIIYYTLDGSTPSPSSPVYNSPISLSSSTTVNAFASSSGLEPSPVAAASYTQTTASGPPIPDDFNGSSLNTSLWTSSAPAGGNVAVSNGHALLVVPGGSNHDAFVGGNNSVRILQSVSNDDFDVTAKFDSSAQQQYQGEGILVAQNTSTYFRFELLGIGNQTIVTADLVSGGNQTQLIYKAVSFNTGSMWLQVQRVGSSWTISSSNDGISYTTAGSFTQSFAVTQIGPYAWNYNANPGSAPALTASVDYFHNIVNGPPSNPPVISEIVSTVSASGASITWNTDIPSTSVANYGTTTSYGSTASNSSLVNDHAITLTGLTCGTAYDYDVSSIASTNQSSTSSNLSFTTSACSGGGGGPTSDNFDEPILNTALWTFVNPLGDGSVTMNGTAATLNIPQGTSHDPWVSGNNALRLLQTVSNSDFTVDVRFQSDVEIGNQDEGIMVQQDATHFVRFDIYSNGQGKNLFAGLIQGSSATSFANYSVPISSAPIWLRLQRSGNNWIGKWSTDGVTFNTGATFTASLTVTSVGPFAGNSASNGQIPAFTAICDYFFNTVTPITNQDGPPTFSVVTVDPFPGAPLVEKTLADIQGTGKLNPVIGLESSGAGLYWYAYPTSGVAGSWTKHTISASGNFYEDILPFDVNGDGAMDLVASYTPPGSSTVSIVWFENPRGNSVDPATTTAWVMHVIGTGSGENTLALADLDGDGKMDVASPSFIFFQNSPTSWTRVQYSTSFRGVSLLDIGSGNGRINLVGTGIGPPYNVIWYENPRESGGNARTGTWVAHVVGPGYSCTPTICGDSNDVATYNTGDLNGDGRMDIVMGQSEGTTSGFPKGGMIWFAAPADRRNGQWVQHTIDANFTWTHAIRIADMDKNGTLDLVTSEQDQSLLRRVAIFFNDGSGNFTEQILSNAEGHNTIVGDVRGSGFLDILNSGHGYYGAPNPLQIFLNPR